MYVTAKALRSLKINIIINVKLVVFGIWQECVSLFQLYFDNVFNIYYDVHVGVSPLWGNPLG